MPANDQTPSESRDVAANLCRRLAICAENLRHAIHAEDDCGRIELLTARALVDAIELQLEKADREGRG